MVWTLGDAAPSGGGRGIKWLNSDGGKDDGGRGIKALLEKLKKEK